MKVRDLGLRKSRQLFDKIGLTYQVIKTALSAGISWAIANNLLGTPYPIFAPLAAMLVIQVAIFDTIERAVYRVLGTIGGVIIGLVISLLLNVNILSIALVVLFSFALSRALHFPPYLVLQVAISALLVLFFSQNSGTEYVWGRIFETLIGAAVAVIVNIFVLPPNPFPALTEKINQLAADVGQILDQVSLNKQDNKHLYEALLKSREVVRETEEIYGEIGQAERSLRYSPLQRKRKNEAIELYVTIQILERLALQTRGITRSMLDLSIRTGTLYRFQPLMAELMKCVVLFGNYAKEPSAASLQLLKTAVSNARQVHEDSYTKITTDTHAVHYNVGSIFTDANRIFEEIEVYTREIEKQIHDARAKNSKNVL